MLSSPPLLSSGAVYKADEDIFFFSLRIPEVLLSIFAIVKCNISHLVRHEMPILGWLFFHEI